MQFAVYILDTPVTLKQSQGHQIYNGNVDPEQDYNHAKFEKPGLNSVQLFFFFFQTKTYVSYLTPTCARRKKKIVVYS